MDSKAGRLAVTTILGFIFGVICMLLSRFGAEVAFWPIGVSFLLHHTVLGLVIGASSLKMHWAAHGLFWGAVFGVFLAIGRVGAAPVYWQVFIFVLVWGFLIELLASKAFRRSQQ
ncbi:MAG: hypothetical protein JSV89_21550 [Spirochaetaceae bacterium]|nr:MAG: hypothetical protein JSV89_21550 [Spirochaetaceae bacterium]